MATVISLEEAQQRLGDDVVVALEPTNNWLLNPKTGESGHKDGKFFAVRPVDRGGYNQLALVEEPNEPQPEDGSPRIVGQVVVEVNPRGLVRMRTAQGLNGPVLELKPSSLSKGELEEDGYFGQPFESNPQRIKGFIQPVLVESDFPDEEGMSAARFVQESTDSRSVTAMTKVAAEVRRRLHARKCACGDNSCG